MAINYNDLAKYVNYVPTMKQEKFHFWNTSHVKEQLFGGGLGGGKTASLIIDMFLYCLVYPKAKCLVLRKIQKDNSVVFEAKTLNFLNSEYYTYMKSSSKIIMNNGSSITFGGIKDESQFESYQGTEWQYIGFDELTHFRSEDYEWLKTRNRGEAGYPYLIRATTNPIGRYVDWVYDKFIKDKSIDTIYSTDVKVKASVNGNLKEVNIKIRQQFIQSLLIDNPHLEAEYLASLSLMSEDQKRTLIEGEWLMEGNGSIFKRGDFRLKEADFNNFERVFSFVDTAYKVEKQHDYTVISHFGMTYDGELCILNYDRVKEEFVELKSLIVSAYNSMEKVYGARYSEMYIEDKASGISLLQELKTEGLNIKALSRGNTSKLSRAKQVSHLVKSRFFINKDMDKDKIRILLAEMCAFRGDGKSHDDIVDTIMDALAFLTTNTHFNYKNIQNFSTFLKRRGLDG